MAKTRLETGSTLDGFVIGDLIHRGGMAHLWEVKRAGDDTPLLMKIPVLHEGEDPAAIVSFEMEQMILPRLSGPHVPHFVANGDFSNQPYIVMERIEGESLLNDGTAVVLFTLVLAYVNGNSMSIAGAGLDFVRVVGMGTLIGVAIGFAAAKVIQRVDDPMIEITLTTIAAYGSFVAAESFHYSGVIATVAAGMLCGNYAARTGMSPSTQIAVESFWEYVAFALNSIVFLLIGFEVRIDMLVSNRPVNLLDEGIDVALRVRQTLDDSGSLVVKRLGHSRSVLVASPVLLARQGTPTRPEELGQLDTVAMSAVDGRSSIRLVGPGGATHVFEHRPRYAADDLLAVRAAVLGGVGALVTGLVVATFVLLRDSAAKVLRHVRLDGELRSRRLRRAASDSWVTPRMNQVAVFELQGVMSFGVAAHMSEQVRLRLLPRHRWVVLDAGRVPAWDSTALAQLRALVRDLDQQGIAAAIAALDPLAAAHVGEGVRVFADLDRALEWAEVAILAQRPLDQRPPRGGSDPLGEIGEGMPREARQALQALLLPQVVPAHGVVFNAGDRDRDLLVVLSGHITLVTQWPPERGLRLATVGPGMVFGEMAFLNGAERSASAGAERGAARLMRLPRERFDGWARQYPEAGLILMENLAQMGARRLAVTTRQLRSMLE